MIELQSLSDLDIIDYLEIYNSTVQVSNLLGISQSSCSRRYRALSDSLAIGFERFDNLYSASSNLDVLFLLRQASQKIRIRQNKFRYSESWHSNGNEIPNQWQNISIKSMDQSLYMNLISNRLIDICCTGIMEYMHVCDADSFLSCSKPILICNSLLAYPIMEWNYALVAHQDHPLSNKSNLAIEDLKKYPSLGLQFGSSPAFMTKITKHGLGSSPYGLSKYDLHRWEAFSKDGYSLSYAPYHQLPNLKNKFNLVPLNYDLNLKELISIVGFSDVVSSQAFFDNYGEFCKNLKNSSLYTDSSIKWYI